MSSVTCIELGVPVCRAGLDWGLTSDPHAYTFGKPSAGRQYLHSYGQSPKPTCFGFRTPPPHSPPRAARVALEGSGWDSRTVMLSGTSSVRSTAVVAEEVAEEAEAVAAAAVVAAAGSLPEAAEEALSPEEVAMAASGRASSSVSGAEARATLSATVAS